MRAKRPLAYLTTPPRTFLSHIHFDCPTTFQGKSSGPLHPGLAICLRLLPCRIPFALLLIVFLAITSLATIPARAQVPPPVPVGCSGNNGSIDVPSNGSVTFLAVNDLQTLVGRYCDQSIGVYMQEGVTSKEVSCAVTVTAEGEFAMNVGGHEIKVPSAGATLMSNGLTWGTTATLKTYDVGSSTTKDVPGGTEIIDGSVSIQANRVVSAGFKRTSYINDTYTEIESGICAFHRRSHVGSMIEGPISYASADNLPSSIVGTHVGKTLVWSVVGKESKELPCSVSVTASGDITVNTAELYGGAPISVTGQLRGRVHDVIGYSQGMTIVAPLKGDAWNYTYSGVSIQLDPAHNLVDAGAKAKNEADLGSFGGDCKITPPTYVDLPSLPICEGEGCLPVNRGVGKTSCHLEKGNPINAASGNKFQRERDYIGAGSVDLQFERVYNSHWSAPSGSVGVNWRTNFDRSMLVNGNLPIVRMLRADGQLIVFKKISGIWRPEAGNTSVLVELVSSPVPQAVWAFTGVDDEVEYYDRIGRLVQISNRGGSVRQRLTYDSLDRLHQVVDAFGNALTFTYQFDDRLATMQVPDGSTFFYSYDPIGNLVSVTIPEVPAPVTRRYFYENTSFPHALTGLEDENGKRFATWKYDSQGRAYFSEHARGVDRTVLGFGLNDATTVTDALNAQRTVNFKTIGGSLNYAGESQPAGSGCAAAYSSATFDDAGNVLSATDFNGVVATYKYENPRRLVISKTEAFGRPEQRTTTTEWHPNYRIPKRIAEPLRLTTFDYFPNGDLRSRQIQATKDATGAQGFAAVLVGPVSTWTYAYNLKGQVESIVGPRLGGIDKTTYTYDAATGHLKSVKNAADHLTTIGDYDSNGRARLITAPSGMTTRITYTARGLIDSQVVSDGARSLTTTFSYDNVGQLTRMTMPDNSYIAYAYDDAHRLTGITDSAGNTINYVLNSVGSREKEEVKDASGTLSRRVTREFDKLNRLQRETGGAQ